MRKFSLCIHGRLTEYDHPAVMGILNVTPDSLFAGSRAQTRHDISLRVEQLVSQGADFIDVGAYSSRPGCTDVAVEEEMARLQTAFETLRSIAPDIPVSVDTFRSAVAQRAVTEWGTDIINDISGGTIDPNMAATVAKLGVPYIIMHMRGSATDMMSHTAYDDVVAEVLSDLAHKKSQLSLLGVNDVIIDPGFGFSKSLKQNYELLRNLPVLQSLHSPVLVGLSRKSMITAVVGTDDNDALMGTSMLNMYAVLQGAAILRVHDVAAARHAIDIAQQLSTEHTP